jgi:transketolase
MAITEKEIAHIEEKAEAIRETIIEMLISAGSGHTAGPLDMADIFAAFYFHILKHDPKKPDWEERDRLILSNGHICPVRYSAMAHAGYFPIEECLTLRKLGSRLQGHPERTKLPGLETTSGPLGSGLSQGAGMAYSLRMNNMWDLRSPTSDVGLRKSYVGPRVYVLMGDGEQDEGEVWEAVMWTAKEKLYNLTAIIDRNNIQIDGPTEDIMPLESLRAKYEAFNWHVLEVDGHNVRAFIDAVEEAKAIIEKPTLIIAHTLAGRGVPDIEGDYHYHGWPKSTEEAKKFLEELRTLHAKVKHEYD